MPELESRGSVVRTDYADDSTALHESSEPVSEANWTGGGLFGRMGPSALGTALFGSSGVCPDAVPPPRRGLSVLGVRLSENCPLAPPIALSPLPSGESQTLRVIQIRVLTPRGEMIQLNPVVTLKCGRMMNRLLGIMFRSTSLQLPGEVRHLFRFVRGYQDETFYLRKRLPLDDYDSILPSHASAGVTISPNWQSGASYAIQVSDAQYFRLCHYANRRGRNQRRRHR